MIVDRLALAPLLVGHIALFVLTINMIHGSGRGEKVGAEKLAALAAFTGLSAWLVGEAALGPFRDWSWLARTYGGACIFTGLVALPLSTAWLHYRRRPAWTEGRETVIDLVDGDGRAGLVGDGPRRWLLGLPGNESFRLRKVEWEAPVAGLPRGLDGLSILHVSDLHLSRCFDPRYFERVLDEAAADPVDLVAFTGDLVDDDEAAAWVAPLMARLKGRLGAFAVLGNHDFQHQPERLRAELASAGFIDLEGAWAVVRANGARVAIGGTSTPWGPPLPLESRPEADFSILLSHAPDPFYWAARSGFDLMLSGHNHGGQIRLPLLGPVFMPSIYSRRFDRGFFTRGRLVLHVSQGVAAKHPIRIGCPPEISRLVLRSTAGVGRPHVARPQAGEHERLAQSAPRSPG
jgi:predicted MPP superfamily phosphohydrolase